jgi:hypothetical protein
LYGIHGQIRCIYRGSVSAKSYRKA